ncbi:response regulator [Thermodesulfobacteriota bacterium]
MTYALEQFIDEAIQLELNAADIYSIFSEAIPEDANFWLTLAWEEKNHAAVLKTGKDVLMPTYQFPGEILPNVIQVLVDTNNWLNSLKKQFLKCKPDRKTAFSIAIKIESSAGEQHFQTVMNSSPDSSVIKILQELCEDDIHHLKKIQDYMKSRDELVEISENNLKNILIVINDNSIAKLLKTILESEGHIDIAENGMDGLQKVQDKDYGLVVSAVEMPVVDGLQFYNKAKGVNPDLQKRFLFFTSEPPSERILFFENEGVRYLKKPSTINEIRAAALSILGQGQ